MALPLAPINASEMAERTTGAAEKRGFAKPVYDKWLEAATAAAPRHVHMIEDDALSLEINA